jgi:NADPH-dependent glutamate synthase beta subunit-like oxidoreductase
MPDRLPREVLDGEIARIEAMGVPLHLNSRVDDLEAAMHGFHAAFVAVGAHLGKRAYVPAGAAARIVDAVSLLRDMEGEERAAGAARRGLRRRQHRLRRGPHGQAPRRASTFAEVVGGLDAETALYEARRCLSCGTCFACDNCFGVCPDNAVIKLEPAGSYVYEVDLDSARAVACAPRSAPAAPSRWCPSRSRDRPGHRS